MTEDKAIVLLSGGIDSATCMALACKHFDKVIPVHVRYGQQTQALEHRMAEDQRIHLDVEYPETEVEEMRVVDYSPVMQHFGGGVADPDKDFSNLVEEDGRSSGYVPMRNLHLIATAAGFADVEGAIAVYHGAQGGDAADYPDCRPTFMDSAAGAISKSLPDDRALDLRTPLIAKEKFEVIKLAHDLGVDFSCTYSCYSEVEDMENPEPCGECPACIERREAFRAAGIEAPIMEVEQ